MSHRDSMGSQTDTRFLFYYFVAPKARLLTQEVLNLIYLIHRAPFMSKVRKNCFYDRILHQAYKCR